MKKILIIVLVTIAKIFGTNSPWTSPKVSIEFIKNLPLADVDKAKILGLNAQRILND